MTAQTRDDAAALVRLIASCIHDQPLSRNLHQASMHIAGLSVCGCGCGCGTVILDDDPEYCPACADRQ